MEVLRLETWGVLGDYLLWGFLGQTRALTFIHTCFTEKLLTVQDHLYVKESPPANVAVPSSSVACSMACSGSSSSHLTLPSLPITLFSPLQTSELSEVQLLLPFFWDYHPTWAR